MLKYLGICSAGMVVMANGTIQGRAYNSSLGQHDPPIWGPVILGTIAGSGGLFLPFDRGLSSLVDGAPHTLKVRTCHPNNIPTNSEYMA